MRIVIGRFEFTEVWDGVLYKNLSRYPVVTDWEIRTLLEFIAYEAAHGRDCPIECDNKALLMEIQQKLQTPEKYLSAPRPRLLTECTACPVRKGCETALVCHTAPPENALSILTSGWLLSAVRARELPAWQLRAEARNAAGDPEDYFDYVMLAWGNCQAGDRLVMERRLGRFPTEEELEKALVPGVRFCFRYDALAEHPGRVFDGVLPMKIRDGIELAPWVYRIVIPDCHRALLEPVVPEPLRERVLYVPHRGEGLWAWSEKVYSLVAAQGE